GATFVANLDTDAFGTRLPETVINHPNVQALKQSTGAAGPILIGTSQQLESAVAGGDVALVLAAAIKAASDLQQFYAALDQLVTEIRNQINPANLPDPNERASAQTFALTLARQIAD